MNMSMFQRIQGGSRTNPIFVSSAIKELSLVMALAVSRPLMSRLLASRLGLRAASSSSSLLVNQGGKYQFLQDLGLKDQNLGVFDGEWKGSGEVDTHLLDRKNMDNQMTFVTDRDLCVPLQWSAHRPSGHGYCGGL